MLVNFRNLIVATISTCICIFPNVSLAQESGPKPDKKGDYYDGYWREWLIVERDKAGTNCRSNPGANYRVVKKFYNGQKIYVFTQGDDNDTMIRYDRQRKPWLTVLPTGFQYEKPCYIRANNRFIQPIPR